MVHKALKLLSEVPKGMATTYGELAKASKTNPRAIGAIMRANKNPDVYRCYKVVHTDGRIGEYSGIGGTCAKAALLKRDGVKITDGKVDESSIHRFG